MKLNGFMPPISLGVLPGSQRLATDLKLEHGGSLIPDPDTATNLATSPSVTEIGSAVVRKMKNAGASERQTRQISRLQKDIAATNEIIERAKKMAERLKQNNQRVKLWELASEAMRLLNQEMALERYRGWKDALSLQNLEIVEQHEEVATGKREKRRLEVPPTQDPLFFPKPTKSQIGYLAFLRARTVARNMKDHGVQTDLLHFQRVVTGMHHEEDPSKVDKAYQAWVRGLDSNSRSQAENYAAIIRGENPNSEE